MIIDILWVLFYRFKCFKVTVDASFYYLVKGQILLSLDNVARAGIWIVLLLVLTPVEMFIAFSVNLFDALGISNNHLDRIKYIMSANGKTKDASKEEFEEYEKFLFEEGKK